MSSSTLTLFLLMAPQAIPPGAASPPAQVQAPAPEARPTPDGAVLAIETTMGTIEIGLFASKSPRSTRNFMNYVKQGFYDGTVFHRVIPGFMIQGGGLDARMNEKPVGPPVRNEARNGLLNRRGSLAMARTDDPQSATAQFFVNVRDNPALDFGISRDGWGYTVFGEVLSGLDVVDRIVAVPTSRRGRHDNVPIKPVVITKVRILSEPPSPGVAKPAPKGSPAPRPSRPSTTPTPAPR